MGCLKQNEVLMNNQFVIIMQHIKRIVKLLFDSLSYEVRHSATDSPLSAGASPGQSMLKLINFQLNYYAFHLNASYTWK